jgi:DNA-binding response OmpR family regulator
MNTDALKGKRVLWAEDDELLGEILEKKLTAQGCILTHVGRGEEVLKFLENHEVDIVILDMLLPGIDGNEVLKRIKTDGKHQDLPVLILSNLNDKEHVAKSSEYGAAKFLIKASLTLDDIIQQVAETV